MLGIRLMSNAVQQLNICSQLSMSQSRLEGSKRQQNGTRSNQPPARQQDGSPHADPGRVTSHGRPAVVHHGPTATPRLVLDQPTQCFTEVAIQILGCCMVHQCSVWISTVASKLCPAKPHNAM